MENYTEDMKLLGTVHSHGSIDEYYHVRIKDGKQTTFEFRVVKHTKERVSSYKIDQFDLPKSIKLL